MTIINGVTDMYFKLRRQSTRALTSIVDLTIVKHLSCLPTKFYKPAFAWASPVKCARFPLEKPAPLRKQIALMYTRTFP